MFLVTVECCQREDVCRAARARRRDEDVRRREGNESSCDLQLHFEAELNKSSAASSFKVALPT